MNRVLTPTGKFLHVLSMLLLPLWLLVAFFGFIGVVFGEIYFFFQVPLDKFADWRDDYLYYNHTKETK